MCNKTTFWAAVLFALAGATMLLSGCRTMACTGEKTTGKHAP